MNVASVVADTQSLLEHLALSEEPFGVHFADTKPENAFGPKVGPALSRALEDEGRLDMAEVSKISRALWAMSG